MNEQKIDWEYVERKALLGKGQRAYLKGEIKQSKRKNKHDKKDPVIKVYQHAMPVIDRFYDDLGLLTVPIHEDNEILAMKTSLLKQLSLRRHKIPVPKLKVPNVYKIVETHEREVAAKYADYIRERISSPRYRKAVALLKRVYEIWLMRDAREREVNQKRGKFSEIPEADMIPVYRQEVYEEKWKDQDEVKKENGIVLSADEVRQIPILKKWGLLHFDATRSYICFGENGKNVASILR